MIKTMMIYVQNTGAKHWVKVFVVNFLLLIIKAQTWCCLTRKLPRHFLLLPQSMRHLAVYYNSQNKQPNSPITQTTKVIAKGSTASVSMANGAFASSGRMAMFMMLRL